MEITTGIFLGLSTLLFIGPVFFYLMKSTLEHGIFAGISVATGIIIDNIIYVFLIAEGLSVFMKNYQLQKWFALSGVILLILLGFNYISKQKSSKRIKEKFSRNSFWVYAVSNEQHWSFYGSLWRSLQDIQSWTLTTGLWLVFLLDCPF